MVPSIILGAVLLIAGTLFRYARIRRNYFLGYRTFHSMKNDTNWTFANKLMANLSLGIGAISTIAGLVTWHYGIDAKHVIYPTLALIVVSIAIVEIRLRKFEK
jgi:uncharacterized membrane protein